MRTSRPKAGPARALAAIASVGLLSAGLVACSSAGGSSDPATSSEPSSSSDDGTTEPAPGGEGEVWEGVDDGTELSMWTRAPLEAQAKALVEAYNATHKNQVKLEIFPNDDMEGKVGAAAQSGQLPDIFGGDVVRLPNWVGNGLFADLTDRIDALPFLDDLAPGHIKAGTSADGKKHTLPFVIDVSIMVWNKDLYREAGLDPDKGPSSMKEFAEQAKAVQKLGKDGVSGTYFGGDCGGCLVFTWFPSIWAEGDEVLSADGTEALLASDSAKALYEIYRDLETSGAIAAGSREETGATWVAPFQEGKIGVMQYPNTMLGALDAAGLDVGVAPIPGVNGGKSTFLGGDALGIAATSKKVDQAWNFLAWMLSEETQVEVVAKNGGVVARGSLSANEYAAKDPRLVTINEVAAVGNTPVAYHFAEAFNAPNSPWVQLVRNSTFEGSGTVDADNEAITKVLSQ